MWLAGTNGYACVAGLSYWEEPDSSLAWGQDSKRTLESASELHLTQSNTVSQLTCEPVSDHLMLASEISAGGGEGFITQPFAAEP
jgi:hypothetical protein